MTSTLVVIICTLYSGVALWFFVLFVEENPRHPLARPVRVSWELIKDGVTSVLVPVLKGANALLLRYLKRRDRRHANRR